MRFSTATLAAAFALLPAAYAWDNYKNTCYLKRDTGIAGSVLDIQCSNSNGDYQQTNVDLNNCITNDNSNLACSPGAGGYAGSCSNCSFSGTFTNDGGPGTMCCDCWSTDGSHTERKCIDTNSCIGNNEGALTC
ncbi:hypothetical protein BKA62DRAFT_33362 [Auriculariales sp. MPI-PUGE-AT-0066]|nr:hypothetical protein BKA62DRAFT_33362 [Auriculariales sp. MPI-PUGE-AT-0066]